MKIIFPINGKGSRFIEDGYTKPKPLINILGKPMIFWVLENLKICEEDEVYFICNEELNKHHFDSLIKNKFPNIKTNFIFISHETRGAAETILHGLNKIKTNNDCLMVIDCDTIYFDDIVSKYRKNKDNRIFYFTDTGSDTIYSYIQLNKNKVKEIKEKERISNNANTGAYCFKSDEALRKECIKVIENDKKNKGEFYISSIYKSMLSSGEEINATKVENFNCVGTPIQLKLFSSNFPNKTNLNNLRICFDLDNTLSRFPTVKGNYSTCEPIKEVIKFLKFLKSQGIYIIIYTARRMKTHKGNVEEVIKDIGKITIDFLDKNNIKYDELIFGKPYADFYIDDLSVDPKSCLERQIGFYESLIEPRKFNKIEITGKTVTKTGDLSGECYWYNNLPKKMIKYTPEIYRCQNTSITMEKVSGIPFSFLFINDSLTINNFNNLLKLLDEFESIECLNNENIYENYSLKLDSRYDKDEYINLKESNVIFNNIKHFLDAYEKDNKGKASFIHGDLVFTNVFLTLDDKIKIIDPKGKSQNKLSIYGDLFYDYAKIYQSLLGYDFILLERSLNKKLLNSMRLYYENYIENKWGKEKIKIIRFISYSLIFSMIPLHEKEKRVKFYNLLIYYIQELGDEELLRKN